MLKGPYLAKPDLCCRVCGRKPTAPERVEIARDLLRSGTRWDSVVGWYCPDHRHGEEAK